MKFYVIASSSKGNASYLEVGNQKILIDAGISFLRLVKELKKINIKITEIDHLFITHEHSDHIKGLEILLKNTNLNVYSSSGTKKALKLKKDVTIIKAFETIDLGDLTITPLPLSHDALEPLGFLFENHTKKLAYLTDTGFIRKDVEERLYNCNLYFLESNHDAYLLANSSRPYYLIRRILNEKGHLSNHDSAYYFSKMMGDQTTHLIWAHISQECNTLELIKKTYEEVLSANAKDFSKIKFIESLPEEPLEVIIL